jgi:hypothetical protein
MRGSDTAQWIKGEDGLRCYFSELDAGGPSRLECYRRLLSRTGRTMRSVHRVREARPVLAVPLRRLAAALELAGLRWNGRHEMAGQ